MAIFFKDKEKDELKEPYIKVRHIAIFNDEDTARSMAKRLNYNLYYPLGLTKDEMRVLFEEERSLFGVKKVVNDWVVIERTVY